MVKGISSIYLKLVCYQYNKRLSPEISCLKIKIVCGLDILTFNNAIINIKYILFSDIAYTVCHLQSFIGSISFPWVRNILLTFCTLSSCSRYKIDIFNQYF